MISSQIFQRTSFFGGVPKNEIEYLVEKSVEIIRRAPDSSLESVLQEVANFHGNFKYGWEEAILDGKWFRWPSEIRNQIFCSEKALTSYLLLKTMGIKSKYAIISDCNGTGLNHEVVFVPNGNQLFLLDWQTVSPVTLEGGKMLIEGVTVEEKNIELIPEDDIVPRVLRARSGESFLDAVGCGQLLYRRSSRECELDTYVEYNDRYHELHFLHILRPFIIAPAFYSDIFFLVEDGSVKCSPDFGIVTKDNGLNFFGNSYLSKISDPIEDLDASTRRSLGLYILYDSRTKYPEGDVFILSEQERKEKLEHFRQVSTDNTSEEQQFISTIVSCYDQFKKHKSQYHAERFLDFQVIQIDARLDYPTQKNIDNLLHEHVGVKNNLWLMMVHLGISAREMAEVVSVESTLECQRKLCHEIARQTSQPYQHVKPSAGLKLIEHFQKNGSSLWGEMQYH